MSHDTTDDLDDYYTPTNAVGIAGQENYEWLDQADKHENEQPTHQCLANI